MKRVMVPNLLRRFVTEEQESIAKQKTERKTFKQFMLMHGTRWAPRSWFLMVFGLETMGSRG